MVLYKRNENLRITIIFTQRVDINKQLWYNGCILNRKRKNMFYQTQQDPSKIVSSVRSGYTNLHMNDGESIPMSSLEAMWFGHEENIDQPLGQEYPVGTNKEHYKLMVLRAIDSINNRMESNYQTSDISYASHSFPATA